MFDINDHVMIRNPEYPELDGIAKIVEVHSEKAVIIEFLDDNSRFHCATRLIRAATKEEINKYRTCKKQT